MVGRKNICGIIGIISLVVITYNTLQCIARMFFLSLSILICAIAEDRCNIEIVIDPLENVIILYESWNRPNAKIAVY